MIFSFSLGNLQITHNEKRWSENMQERMLEKCILNRP